ncbi:MAG: hypothetical protein RXS42_06970, partial [Nitrososphaeria archaeon]
MLVTTCTRTAVPGDGIFDEGESELAYMVVVLPPATVTDVDVGDDGGGVPISVNVTIGAPVLALSRLTCVIVTGVVPVLVTMIV